MVVRFGTANDIIEFYRKVEEAANLSIDFRFSGAAKGDIARLSRPRSSPNR